MLIYALRIRPDIATSISLLSVRTAECTNKDYGALRRVAAYLYQTIAMELVDSPESRLHVRNVEKLYPRSDAAYLTHRDSKSHYGICVSYGSKRGMFFSKSGKQNVVSTSKQH